MPGKPPGSLVSLTYDSPRLVDQGDVIETGTGRRYRVESVRVSERGKYAGHRKHLMAVVLADDEPNPEGATVHPLRWYTRQRRSRA